MAWLFKDPLKAWHQQERDSLRQHLFIYLLLFFVPVFANVTGQRLCDCDIFSLCPECFEQVLWHLSPRIVLSSPAGRCAARALHYFAIELWDALIDQTIKASEAKYIMSGHSALQVYGFVLRRPTG